MTMLGIKHSEETKKKIRDAHKGKKKPWAGRYVHQALAEEHKRNIGKSLIGREVSLETRKKIKGSLLGHIHPEETKEKISLSRRGKYVGEANHNWKGGVTPEKLRVRKSTTYKRWRAACLKRDNYTCQFCGVANVKFEVDHIKRFADYPELRLELANGRTLCKPCHKKTGTMGR